MNAKKQCSRCRKLKSLAEYNNNRHKRDGKQTLCRSCCNGASRQHYDQNKAYYAEKRDRIRGERREWFREIKAELICAKCGETHPACLEFHHLSGDKKGVVSWLASAGRSKEVILREISKCEVLCSNCHRKLHWDLKYSGVDQ